MKLKNASSFLLLLLLFISSGEFASAQKSYKDSLINFEDDPIAAMLDSLSRFNYFEKSQRLNSAKSKKYHYSADSIPRFDAVVYESRLAKIDPLSPFDLEYNDAVKGYIELYTVRKRELVSRVLGMSQMYFPIFEQMLDKYNLPLEFKYLAIVESALNPNAKSKSGATGLWQFMYPTGKMFGLNVNSYVDERCDPYKATVSACEYFTYLYNIFGDWQMVLAAYNSGPGTVNKAIRRSGGKKTYWEIRPYLPVETRGYVPAFIAVNYVMNYATEHNLSVTLPKRTFSEIDTISITQQITFEQLSAVLDISVEEMKFLNPMYKKNVIPFDAKEPFSLCLPVSKIGSFITNEASIYNYLKKSPLSSTEILAMQDVMKTYVVKRGERLGVVASKFNCTIADIKMWNNLKSTTLRTGQKLIVYVAPKVASSPGVIVSKQEKKSPVATTEEGKFKYHIIQNGDTLWTIAKSNGVSVEEIKKWNNLESLSKLIPGKKIKVGVSG